MKAEDYRSLIDALLPSVLAAGRTEMLHFNAGVEVTTKADATPVTIADHEAEAILAKGLNTVAPGIPVVAEEAMAAGRVPKVDDRFFLVDPLDGTRAYIRNSPEFTINIGLIENQQATFGIIYAPALSQLYVTLGTDEAVEIDIAPDSTETSLSGLAMTRLSGRQSDPKALVAFASRSHAAENTEAFLKQFPIAEKRKASSSLKFCLVAKGEADLYARLGETSEWDTAAGQAILTAAGGCVTTLDGAPLVYGKSEGGFANPHFVAWVREPLI